MNIKINQDKCTGCGLCFSACHEGVIALDKGKAKIVRADYCDGLGNCLSVCPSKAISFEESNFLVDKETNLRQWPIKIKLLSANAKFLKDCDLFVAADCTAFSDGNFHKYMKDKTTIIGCPKLDNTDYFDKLTMILKENNIKSITVARMEVPCCGGLEYAVKEALKAANKNINMQVLEFSVSGKGLKK